MDSIQNNFDFILEKVKLYLPGQNLELLKKSYEFSLNAHKKQTRAGGTPYITHPLAVVNTLADLHLDIPTLCAGFLHDVVEDTPVSHENIVSEFGEEISRLVEGVTKIDALQYSIPEHASTPELIRQAENWRKMLIATAHDIRIVILKLADRKHNMETLQFLPPEKQKKIAEETLNLYAPLAQRLGMYTLKSTLEDYALKFSEPEKFSELEKKMKENTAQREDFLKNVVEKVESILSQYAIPHKIFSRPKNLNSIYRKMIRQNKPFEEIQDLAGIRLITDTVEHCYALLGIIHSNFVPVPDSFTDYIAIPKNNLYQSLHTTAYIGKNELIEIQIRTEEMHQIAEYGVAAHWRYKLGSSNPKTAEDSVEDKLDWVKQIMEWQRETKNPKEFLEGLRIELEFDQVFVFTPKGEVIKLPTGSTPVDFAYAVHTDLGNLCVGAKVDGKMVRLDHQLKSGNGCEIITRKGQKPHKDWLEFVKTPRAKSKIRKFLRENE